MDTSLGETAQQNVIEVKMRETQALEEEEAFS